MSKEEWLMKNGFNPDGLTYCVIGETYSIKNKLKELGYRYSPILKWHAAAPSQEISDRTHVVIDFHDIYEWNEELNTPFFLESAEEKINKVFAEANGPSHTEYVGYIGDRLRNITAIYSSSRGYMGHNYYTYIHTFNADNACLVWFTTKELILEKGTPVLLSGTIEAHEEFRGVRTTRISRCKITPIGE